MKKTTSRFAGLRLAILCALAAPTLGGCIVPAVIGASSTLKDQAVIVWNEDAAEAGDPAAQYELGVAHCCAVSGSSLLGDQDNQKATHWLCKAAARNYSDAEYELGRIYSGDLSRGTDLPGRLFAMAREHPKNNALALMWFDLAAAHGSKDAPEKAGDLKKSMTPAEVAAASADQQNPRARPCEWNDVYPDRKV